MFFISSCGSGENTSPAAIVGLRFSLSCITIKYYRGKRAARILFMNTIRYIIVFYVLENVSAADVRRARGTRAPPGTGRHRPEIIPEKQNDDNACQSERCSRFNIGFLIKHHFRVLIMTKPNAPIQTILSVNSI